MANMLSGPGPIALRRFTVEQYHIMAETGILSPDERVELVSGVVREVSPRNRAHVLATWRVFDRLAKPLAGRARIFKEDPLVLVELDSEPEPDLMVCSNPDVEAYGTGAMEPLLVVEVAESTLAYDLGDKAKLYAEAGIPEYWVLNLVDRVLVVFREPRDGRFESRSEWGTDSSVAPEAWPDVEVDVASLFPAHTSNGG